MIWALLLAGIMALSAPAMAQGFGNNDDELFGDSSSNNLLDFQAEDIGTDDGIEPIQDGGVESCVIGHDDAGLATVSDVSESLAQEVTRDQDVTIDEDDVLLGIALANNGASDVSFNALRDFDLTRTRLHTESRVADLERDDVFSALALGVDSGAGSLEALACVSDREITFTETTTASQTVDLDEDNVLLAIALANSVGGDLRLDDIASISQSARKEVERDQTVDIDREDAFLALALGAGGSG